MPFKLDEITATINPADNYNIVGISRGGATNTPITPSYTPTQYVVNIENKNPLNHKLSFEVSNFNFETEIKNDDDTLEIVFVEKSVSGATITARHSVYGILIKDTPYPPPHQRPMPDTLSVLRSFSNYQEHIDFSALFKVTNLNAVKSLTVEDSFQVDIKLAYTEQDGINYTVNTYNLEEDNYHIDANGHSYKALVLYVHKHETGNPNPTHILDFNGRFVDFIGLSEGLPIIISDAVPGTIVWDNIASKKISLDMIK